MSTNGGTLHGVPQNHHNCSECGLVFDSEASFQVHQHYHRDTINRWGGNSNNVQSTIPPPPTSNSSSASPTDSDNNNQPSSKLHQKIRAASSPVVATQNNTIAAAADSSDNQPPTPTPQTGSGGNQNNSQNYSGTASPYLHQQSLPPPPSELGHYAYMHSYDQFYHPHNPMDYGGPPLLPPPHHLNNHHSHPHHHQQQQEYKPVPSSRYHPYMHNNGSGGHHNSPPVTQSSLSPSVVSSSSPTTTSSSSSIQPSNNTLSAIAPGQPTPSPSPKQCDKCGMVCDSVSHLNDHYSTVHPNYNPNENSRNTDDSQTDMHIINFGITQHHIKEEQPSDILDLDSQKMVYPPHDPSNDTVLPPMNTLHGLHALQRPPMTWGHDPHPFMTPHHQQEIKLSYYSQQMPNIKQEYPIIKSEYGSSLPPIPPSELKQFGSDSTSGNQVTTSPNDFPTTTTPQENGPQFRTFEPPTSSHPTAAQIKATTWKSNEARRPKTYNCTACNKWFTSSGHLKRHYNTTLHKNAVKSSGQPDPATLPISVHHHPARDPNSKHSRKNSPGNAAAQHAPAPPAPPPDPPRSPEYTPQYTPPSGFGHQQAQGFQQYNSSLHSTSNAGGPPNGQAGPSVLASQPRGLLIYSNNNMAIQQQQEQIHHPTTTTLITIPHHQHLQLDQLHHHLHHPHSQEALQVQVGSDQDPEDSSIINIINSTGQYNITSPMDTTINTNTITTPLYQVTQHLEEDLPSYHSITGNNYKMQCDSSSNHHHQIAYDYTTSSMDDLDDETGTQVSMQSDHDQCDEKIEAYHTMVVNRLSGGAAMYQGDTAPPFSPDIPEPYHTTSTTSLTSHSTYHDGRSTTPQMAETAPHSPSSPSVSSTGTMVMGAATSVVQNYHSMPQQPTQTTSASMTASVAAAPIKSELHRCEQCDKVFNKVCYLTQHNKTFHSGDKPYKCQRCGKRFPCDQSHEEHFAKHGGNKPFKCELCPKQFNHKTDLRRHMCVHSGSKPYACELCGKGFIRKDHMIKHLDTHRRKSSQKEPKISKKSLKESKVTEMTKLNDEFMDIHSLNGSSQYIMGH